MTFHLSQASLAKLEGVDPNLAAVVKRAIELTTVDFKVVQGLRTKEEAYVNWGKGRTVEQLMAASVPLPGRYAKPLEAKVTWLAKPLGSKHITGKAVDLLPAPYDWKDPAPFAAVNVAMQAAAKELGVKVIWGGAWLKSPDLPHHELA
jgi:peptidoglycan L-alanyl-D-glutamate endopeptidase CwlK